MKKKTILHSLIFLLIFSQTFAVESYEDKQISNISIQIERPDPDVTYDTHAILKKMNSHKGDRFSQTTFDSDLKMLSKEYDRVIPQIETKGGGLSIKLKIWPRPIIQTINWNGNNKYSSKKLQNELDIKAGTVFNRHTFNKQFNKVKEYYVKKGYFESQLSYKALPIEGTNRVNIEIDIKEGKSGHIKKIVLSGFTNDERVHIANMMFTKQYNFMLSWLTGSGTFKDEAIEQDKLAIISYLHNRGYADARVDISLSDDPDSDKINININAHRGPVYHFGTITFDGNQIIDNEKIESAFLVHTGDTYSPDKLRETAQAIKNLYGAKGHIEADVDYETQLDEDGTIFNVNYYITEGEEFRIGMIRIIGNENTNSNVILRESLLVPGEVFDSRRLQATQQRLEAIGYFKNVNVYAVRSDDDDSMGANYRDVYIEVEETTTGSMSLFVGFSSSNDVYGGLELTERNFNIGGVGCAFTEGPKALRGGGEYFHIRTSIGAKQTNYLISWMDPYVRDTLWRLGVEVVRTTSNLQSDDYDVDTVGFSVFTSYPLTRHWTYGSKYRFRYTNTDVDKDKVQLEEKLDHAGILSAVNTTLSYDSTDRAYKPHKGLRSGLEVEAAGIGGRFRFLKTAFVNTLYAPIWSKGVTKWRAETRFIWPWGDKDLRVPVSEKYFLGGETTVRGYKPFHIGPLVNNEPIGGISSTLLSFEYNQEIFKLLDAFVFVDAGNVSQKTFTISKLRASVGAGVRLELMNRTPIILGYGYPINPRSRKDDEQRFFFSMAGQF